MWHSEVVSDRSEVVSELVSGLAPLKGGPRPRPAGPAPDRDRLRMRSTLDVDAPEVSPGAGLSRGRVSSNSDLSAGRSVSALATARIRLAKPYRCRGITSLSPVFAHKRIPTDEIVNGFVRAWFCAPGWPWGAILRAGVCSPATSKARRRCSSPFWRLSGGARSRRDRVAWGWRYPDAEAMACLPRRARLVMGFARRPAARFSIAGRARRPQTARAGTPFRPSNGHLEE